MIIRHFYDENLAQASYLVACGETGEAIVIDPIRDIAQYLKTATQHNLRITAVTETHIHADFVSGTRELAAATGATMYLSDEGDDQWKYDFADEQGARLITDGFVIQIGNLSLKAIHTSGHTPEHLSFLLTDNPAGQLPHSLFTGDFLFVGDVGRPDLLELVANMAGTMEESARSLFRSVQKLRDLPDSLLIWPGHGAGSACGKSLGGSPVSSLGYERETNWALSASDEQTFVATVLSGQPDAPPYFKTMKRLNKAGPPILTGMPKLAQLMEVEGMLVDVRKKDVSRSDYHAGSLVIPSGTGLTNWAGWLLEYEVPVTLLAESERQANVAARDLATIGLDVVAGWMEASNLTGGGSMVPTIACGQLTGTEVMLDIRNLNERQQSLVRGSIHIPLGYLAQRVGELPTDRKIVVHCASGARSPIALSILKRAGLSNVAELIGGLRDVAKQCPALVIAG
ncbi:MAG: MBL fold metallo-hydrolase [Chthonomonas sp.]|nr:MBL fold metallo-hydrolase [Chthonomonas sp.]